MIKKYNKILSIQLFSERVDLVLRNIGAPYYIVINFDINSYQTFISME